jgi:hypothetical protein
MRAAQSKGIVDLLVLWPAYSEFGPEFPDDALVVRSPWLVQCKYSIHGGGTISPADRSELTALAVVTGAIPVVATPCKNGRGIEFVNLHTKGSIG